MEEAVVDEVRARIEKYVGQPMGPVSAAPDPVNVPMIRHWVAALDDRNPVYLDEGAAARSRHGGLVAPWHLQRSGNVQSGLVSRTVPLFADVGLVYAFAWLAPLGIAGFRALPLPWRTGSASAAMRLAEPGRTGRQGSLQRRRTSSSQTVGQPLGDSVAAHELPDYWQHRA